MTAGHEDKLQDCKVELQDRRILETPKCGSWNVLFVSESESEYLLSQHKFTRKFVLRCTVRNR